MRELQPSETDQWTSARCSRACRAGAATYGVKQSDMLDHLRTDFEASFCGDDCCDKKNANR